MDDIPSTFIPTMEIPWELAEIIAEYSSEYFCEHVPCPDDGDDHWGDDGYYYFNYCNRPPLPGFVEALFITEKCTWYQKHQQLLHAPVEFIQSAIAKN